MSGISCITGLMKEGFPASLCLSVVPVQYEILWMVRERSSCKDSSGEEVEWHKVLEVIWYMKGPEIGLLECSWPGMVEVGLLKCSRPPLVEVDLLKWLRPGVLEVGLLKWSCSGLVEIDLLE